MMTMIRSILFVLIISNAPVIQGQSSLEDIFEQFQVLKRKDPAKALNLVDSIRSNSEANYSDHSLLDLMQGQAHLALNEYPVARIFLSRACDKARLAMDSALLAQALVGLAHSNYKLSDLERAIEEAEIGLRLSRINQDSLNEALALNLIGNISLQQKDYKRALTYFELALLIHQNRGDSSRIAGSYNNVGNVFLRQEKYEEAERNFRLTLEIDSLLGSKAYMAGDFNNLGLVMKNRGDFRAAERFQLASMKINRELNLPLGIAGNLNNLGNIYERTENFDESEKAFLEGKRIADSLNYRPIQNDILANLSDLYALTGRNREAVILQRELIENISQVYTDDVAKNLTSFNDYYELLQKEAEIASLRQKEELSNLRFERTRLIYILLLVCLVLFGVLFFWWQRTRLLKRQMQMQVDLQYHQLKAIQLQMNPHFLFNTLGAIGNSIEEKSAKDAAQLLSKFSKLMRNILDAAQSPSTMVDREVKLLTRYLELEALRSDGSFEFEVLAAQGTKELSMPSMVIQPLVENAVLHGVRKLVDRKGSISVRFFTEDSKLVCEVRDNGPGFGVDKASDHQSLGLRLIDRRLELLSKDTGQNLSLDLNNVNSHDSETVVRVYLGDGNFGLQ